MKRVRRRGMLELVGVVVLFQEEIEDLMALMGGDGARHVTIHRGDVEFDSLDELREHHGVLHRRLELVVNDEKEWNRLTVSFTERFVTVQADAAFDAEAREVRDELRRHRRLVSKAGDGVEASLGAAGLGVGVTLNFATTGLLSWLGLGLVAYVLFIPKPYLKTKLLLERRHRHETFWERHQENIWRLVIAVASAAIGAVVASWWRGSSS